MKKIAEVALGVVTGIGGFLEVGSLATSAQGGSEFGFQLGWAVLLGSVSLMVLMEASGRLAAVSDSSSPHSSSGSWSASSSWRRRSVESR